MRTASSFDFFGWDHCWERVMEN